MTMTIKKLHNWVVSVLVLVLVFQQAELPRVEAWIVLIVSSPVDCFKRKGQGSTEIGA
jgi:hypothetical protein